MSGLKLNRRNVIPILGLWPFSASGFFSLPFLGEKSKSVPGSGFVKTIRTAGLDTNLVCCLDAGAQDSYDGTSQTWYDQTENGNNFYLGDDSGVQGTDVSFQGTAGAESSNEYFVSNSGRRLTEVKASSVFDSFHKDGAQFTMAFVAYCTGDSAFSLFGNSATQTVAVTGVHLYVPNNATYQHLNLSVFNGSTRIVEVTSANQFVAVNTWQLLVYSYNETTGQGHWRNGNNTETFSVSYSSPSSGAPEARAQLFAGGNGQGGSNDGSRLAGFFAWDRSLSISETQTLYNSLLGRYI
jgi:hypothetical protein